MGFSAGSVANVSSEIMGGTTEKGDAGKTLKTANRYALKFGKAITGRNEENIKETVAESDEVIAYLKEQGMDADTAFVLQQQLAGVRGDDLSAAVERLQDLANGISQGFVKPEQMQQLGGILNQSLMQQAASGNVDLQEAFDVMELEGIESVPGIRESMAEIQQLGEGLGQGNQQQFDQRFDPMMTRLNQQFDERSQSVIQNMNRRGIRAGSSNEAHQQQLLGREYGQAATDAALQAQSQGEAQRVSEYSARQQEPDNLLRLNSASRENTGALLNRYQLAVQEAGQPVALQGAATSALSDAYTTRAGTEAPLAAQRRDQTLGTYLDNTTMPVSQTAAIQAGVAPAAIGGASQIEAGNTAADVAEHGQNLKFVSDMSDTAVQGMSAMAASGGSDVNQKNVMGPVDDDEAMGALRRIPVSNFEYKDSSEWDDGQMHVGGMAQDMPDEVTNPEHTGYNMQDYMGMLTSALRSLDKRLAQVGV